jgi:hypothetical protein
MNQLRIRVHVQKDEKNKQVASVHTYQKKARNYCNAAGRLTFLSVPWWMDGVGEVKRSIYVGSTNTEAAAVRFHLRGSYHI